MNYQSNYLDSFAYPLQLCRGRLCWNNNFRTPRMVLVYYIYDLFVILFQNDLKRFYVKTAVPKPGLQTSSYPIFVAYTNQKR